MSSRASSNSHGAPQGPPSGRTADPRMLAGKPRPAPAHGMSPSYRLFRRCVIALGRILFGFETVGGEKVPMEGALIVASNHARYLDPIIVCMAVPRRLQWMAKKELFVGPLDRFFALLGAFPVDRKKGGRAALRTALALLRSEERRVGKECRSRW